jgi:hypothetical protein
MNDLFSDFHAAADIKSDAIAGSPQRSKEAVRPGSHNAALSPAFNSLAARADKIDAYNDMRDPYGSPNRTVNLLRVLKGDFPDAWERARAAELIDVCPARHLIELVGSRSLAEKIADALRFPVSKLLEN